MHTVTAANSNEVQTVTLTNAEGGHFHLTLGGQTTTALDFDAEASEVKSALVALSTVGTGNVEVTGERSLCGGVPRDSGRTHVADMTADGSDLIGTDVAIAVAETHKAGRPGN